MYLFSLFNSNLQNVFPWEIGEMYKKKSYNNGKELHAVVSV